MRVKYNLGLGLQQYATTLLVLIHKWFSYYVIRISNNPIFYAYVCAKKSTYLLVHSFANLLYYFDQKKFVFLNVLHICN